nr:Ger(x)C family spore germination protein [Lysinibacillus timonensis]
MRNIKRLLYFLFLLFMLLLLTGCWDQVSIDKRAYVVAIGLDKGEKNHINVTYLISNPEFSKQEGPTSEPSQEVITFPANDFITAKNIANSVIAKNITYSMLGVLIVSEEFAKDSDFIRYMYDATKDREIKRNIPMVVTKENVSTFLLENKPNLETRIHKYFEYILENANQAGLIANNKIHSYFAITEADSGLFLATYATTKGGSGNGYTEGEDEILAGGLNIEGDSNDTQFIGSAVFKEGKMIGTLNGEETRLAIMLNETLEMGDIYTSYPDPLNPQYRISTRIMKRDRNEVVMDLNRYTPTIDVTIPLYLDILSVQSMETYDEGKLEQLKSHIEETIMKKFEKLVNKTQEDFKGEPFGWALIARKKFWTSSDFEDYDWMKTYPNMRVNVKVNVTIGTFGEQSELPSINEVRD